MASLRWRGEGKEREVKKEGEETEEGKGKTERKRASIPAAAGGEGEATFNKEETPGGSGGHGHGESKTPSESGGNTRVNHRLPGHPVQAAVWLFIIILGEPHFVLISEVLSDRKKKKNPIVGCISFQTKPPKYKRIVFLRFCILLNTKQLVQLSRDTLGVFTIIITITFFLTRARFFQPVNRSESVLLKRLTGSTDISQ